MSLVLHLHTPMLSSRGIIVLCFPFRSMIHPDLIFVKGLGSVYRFTFFACECSMFPTQFVERVSFLHFILFLCQRSIDYIYVGLFLASVFCSTDLLIYSFIKTIHLDYCSFIISHEVG